LLNRVPFWMN